MPQADKLPINTNASAQAMAEAMFGTGINIVSANYTGARAASGIYSDGDDVAPELTPSDTGVILSTGRARDITNSGNDANRSSSTSNQMGRDGDDDLNAIAGTQTYDAAVFEAEFIPAGETLTMQVVFSSEEYLEYVGSGFNDAVGIWVNGVKAELTVGDGDITINNINDQSNENLYVDNPANAEIANTEMDGFTVTMTLKAPVIPGQVNTIKIGIADGGDDLYDSNLLIAGNSVQCALIAGDDSLTIDGDESETLDVLANDTSSTGSTLTITHVNGQAVSAGDEITLPSGESVTLNADGTLTFTGDGQEGSNVLTYTVADEDGNTDVGFINLTTTPCFVAGTLIETETGPRPVERLAVGCRIVTRDHGLQTLRWIGRTTRPALGPHAPIEFAAGALGAHGRTCVSPQHRVLVTSPRAQLLFGASEVLAAAKSLVNGQSIRVREGGVVTYVHLLFDRHQIVLGDGLASESYHPGAQTLATFDPAAQAEILDLMPDLAVAGFGYGAAARRALKAFEARLLAA